MALKTMMKFLLMAMLSFVCECRYPKNGLLLPMNSWAIAKKGLCPEGGGDKNAGCQHWKKLGLCLPGQNYYQYVTKTCPASCELCQARPTPPPKPHVVKVNVYECLKAHNSKRTLHRARPLTWDSSLAREAQDWALDLATRKIMEHSPTNDDGENLYESSTISSKPATCKEAVEAWYGEVSDYPFWSPPNSIFDVDAQIGHFTQIVWKSTKKLGVGIASVKHGFWTTTYIVARYSPPGNYDGRFKQQVGKSVMALK